MFHDFWQALSIISKVAKEEMLEHFNKSYDKPLREDLKNRFQLYQEVEGIWLEPKDMHYKRD